MSNIDAIHFCFRNKKATEKIVKIFLEKFPEAKVSLIVDKGGFDFSYLKNDHISAEHHDDYNMGGTGPNALLDSKRMSQLFYRVKKALNFLDKKYVLILEDDVLVTRRFDPEEAGEFVISSTPGNYFPDSIKSDYPQAKLSFWGLGGGSIFSREHFISICDEIIQHIGQHHDEMCKKFVPLGAFDCCAAFHFARHGFEIKQAQWLDDKSIIHPWKDLYPPGWRNDNHIEWEDQ